MRIRVVSQVLRWGAPYPVSVGGLKTPWTLTVATGG